MKDRLQRFLAIDFHPCAESLGGAPEIAVRRAARGWEIESIIGLRKAADDDTAAALAMVMLSQHFQGYSRLCNVHAGAIVGERGAVLYLGDLRQGKSSLTFSAWCDGYDVLGDDRIALGFADRTARPLPKCLKIRLDDNVVPVAWRSKVSSNQAFVARINDEWRWILSRGLPRVVDNDSAVPLHAIVKLRRLAAGPTHIDQVPAAEVFNDAMATVVVGESTPLDLLRMIKAFSRHGRIPRLNIAQDEVEKGLALLADL